MVPVLQLGAPVEILAEDAEERRTSCVWDVQGRLLFWTVAIPDHGRPTRVRCPRPVGLERKTLWQPTRDLKPRLQVIFVLHNGGVPPYGPSKGLSPSPSP